MVGVLAAMSTITQLRQPVAAAASVMRVALLTPRIAIHVVPTQLPEAGLVALGELKSVHPLRRLPEVKMRNKKARGPPVIPRQRLAFVLERDHRLARRKVRDWNVGGVSVVAMRECKRGGRANASVGKNVVYGYALPRGVELRPGGHAVDVSRHPGLWQRLELRPVPHFDRTRSDLQRERPVHRLNPRGRSGCKHREIVNEVLSRGDPVHWFRSGMAAVETASDHGGF